MTRHTLLNSSRPTATRRLASAVAVTTERSELPMLFAAALTKYGGSSSRHDDERIALEQVHPGRLAGRGQRRVVGVELLPPAELLRDRAPDPEGRIALPPGERHDPDRTDVGRRVEAAHDPGPQLRMPGEQAERQQVVRLAAAHRLGQLEDALRGPALQPAEPLGEERPHPLRDVVLGKERDRIDPIPDEVREVENGVASRGIEGRGPGDAGLPDGSHRDSNPITPSLNAIVVDASGVVRSRMNG